MRLLERNSMTQTAVIEDISLPLDIEERDATATWTPESLEGISVGSWLLRDEDPGNGTVFVVRSIRRSFHNESARVQLEHVINLLKDKILFGEIKAKDITGNANDTTCTARQAIEYVLSKQSDWVLGNFDYDNISNPYKFDGETLYDAIEKVSGSLEGAWWSYDMSVYPFELNITAKTEDVESELRASRNLTAIERTIEKTGMFTRFYPIGKDDLHITGEYRSKNDNIYGVVEKSETDQSLSTEAELIAWADEQLSRHAEPLVSITAEGIEISKATGEPLDKINLGRYCRVPLPEYDTVITERIIKISYTDAVKMPELFKATMANKREDVTRIIADAIKRGGGGRRHAARQDKEDHAWFEDTDNHVAMVAEGIAGTDEEGNPNWARLSQIIVDEHGIDMMVSRVNEDVTEAFSRIDQTEERITIEVASAVSGIAHSVIEQTATYIRTEVENAASAISHTVIEQTTEYVRTEVSAIASGVAWSVITQTMTNIEQQIARKSKIYVQWNDPNDGTNVLYEGDIWIKRQTNRTWNEANAAHEKWTQEGVSWRSKYGDLQYVWRNNRWNLLKDTSTDIENETRIEQNSKSVAIIGRAVDLQENTYDSKLEVTARAIRSEVSTAQSSIYSTITQTASNIRTEVTNVIDGMSSSIEQTASQIRTEVSAAQSTIYSTITQTASSIRTEVANTASGLRSSITQTASQIRTEVSAAQSTIYSTITQTASSIRTEVANTASGLRSTITQTASQIRTEVSAVQSTMYSIITQTASKVAVIVDGNGNIKPAEIVASINGGSSTIKLSANHIDIDGIVSYLQSTNMRVQSLLVDGDVTCEEAVVAASLQGGEAIIDGYISCDEIDVSEAIVLGTGATLTIDNNYLKMGNYWAQWKSKSVVTAVAVTYKSVSGTIVATSVESVKETIYYLGR